MQPHLSFKKQPWIFRRNTWVKIRVKISQCTVHVGAWRVWPHQLFPQSPSSSGTTPLLQQHTHTAGNYKLELQHLMVCCISLSLYTLFISALPLGRLPVLILPRRYNNFMLPHFSHPEPKLKNIHIGILHHLYILIFFIRVSFLLMQ